MCSWYLAGTYRWASRRKSKFIVSMHPTCVHFRIDGRTLDMLHVSCKEGVRVLFVLAFVCLAEADFATEHDDSIHYLLLPQSKGHCIFMRLDETACCKKEPEATEAVP